MDKGTPDIPPGRVRMPFPVPQHRVAAPGDDLQRYQEETAKGSKPEEREIVALSTAAYTLFHHVSESNITTEQAQQIMAAFKQHAIDAGKLLEGLPMPQSSQIDGDTGGKVFAPYMFMLGLNLLSHGMAEVSPQTTLLERFAMVSEFVRSWAMMGQISTLADTPIGGLQVRYTAAGNTVMQPPFLPGVAKLAAQVIADQAKHKPEPEREIQLAPGDGEAGVQRPRFRLEE